MSYECHITSMTAHAPRLAELAERSGWKTSEIARDPVLGDDTYFYLTKHSHDFPEIFVAMMNMATVLEANDIPVVRKKIELIVYDTKAKPASAQARESRLARSTNDYHGQT